LVSFLLLSSFVAALMKMWLEVVLSLSLPQSMNHLLMMHLCFLLVSVSYHSTKKTNPNDHQSASRTRDLASSLDGSTKTDSETNSRLVLTIAFQFTFDNHSRDNVATMARQYVRNVVGSIQRVALAITPRPGSMQLPTSPEALTLVRWITRSYSIHTGADLFGADSQSCGGDTLLKQLWDHSDAILCCSLKTNASPVFTFANQAGLDMLETTLVALQDIMLDKTLDDSGRRALCSEFAKIMQQGYANLPAGICVSSMGRPVSYEQATVWKVVDDNESNHCLAFTLVSWSFV
jgi:homeobox-leucine zipper protein